MNIKVKIENYETLLYGTLLHNYEEMGYLIVTNILKDNVECKSDNYTILIAKQRIRIY